MSRTDRQIAHLRRLAETPSIDALIDAIAEPMHAPRIPDDGRTHEVPGGWWSWMWDARGERRVPIFIPRD